MTRSPVAPLPVQAQKITSSLHPRFWHMDRDAVSGRRALVLLSDGDGEWTAGDSVYRLQAPCLFWLSRPENSALRLSAGTTGYLAEMEDEATARAVGDYAESLSLRFLADRTIELALTGRVGALSAVSSSLDAILEELLLPQAGSVMLLAAHLRIILVVMFRISGDEEIARAGGGDNARLLQRFRQLVETNFRAHWRIAAYAEALGISHDRLHAICARGLGKTPKSLVSERLAREAAQGLERSLLTLEQLSHALGFKDPAHFSHFFKRTAGMSPGAYRQSMIASLRGGIAVEPASFADWP
jgi:AraC-like DNA-binding protein